MPDETTTEQAAGARTSGGPTPAVRPFAQSVCDELWSALFAAPAGAQRVRSVLMASAGRREGVTTLLAGAALTGASLPGSPRVALLDLNIRHPRLAWMLGAAASPGLADVLAGAAELAAVAQPIGQGNLRFYPNGLSGRSAGAGAASALVRLPGEQLAELVGKLAGECDYLLCDCAPANLYPDAQKLAGMFDGVVLVAEAGATRRESLAQAKKRVELGHGRVLGVVLNKRRYPVPRFLYRRS